jgi:hypothetical protein
MQALVHFAVGLAGGLLVFSVVDRSPRDELVLIFASGFWAMVPDFHWLLHEAGIDRVAAAWKAVHRTRLVDVFWLHRTLDLAETGQNNLEAGVALAGCVVALGIYYWVNDWTTG